MTLTADTLLGRQTPRVLFRPDYVSEEHGEEAVALAKDVGLVLDPWQALVVRVALAERADGRYAAAEVGALIARQNGKGAILEAIALDSLFLQNDPLVLWTAHQFKTTSEAFLRLRGWVDGSDELRRRVKRVTAAHGEEGIELRNGCRLRFIARSKSSGRGFSPQRVIWDEAQELPTAATEALIPAMRAQPNRQSIFVGTVPSPDTNHPQHWTRLRNRGRAGQGTRLAWLEWTPDGSDDPDTASTLDHGALEVIAAANPGLGYRIDLETLQDDREAMDPDSFGRESLSIWPTMPEEGMGGPVDLDRWARRRNAKGKLAKGRPVCLAVDVTPGRTAGTIAVAGPARKGDRPLVMCRTRPGVEWLVEDLVRLTERYEVLEVMVDPGGPAGAVLPEIHAAGLSVTPVTVRALGHATGGLCKAVEEGRLEHLGQPELDAAVKGARVRMVGDVEVWSRSESTTDVAPLIAASLALSAFTRHGVDDYDPTDSIG